MIIARLISFISAFVVLAFLFFLLLPGIVTDRIHIEDTLLLTHLGWRGVNGLLPVIDYPHFYGGAVAMFVTWAFQIFGVSFVSLNLAFAMMFGVTTFILASVCYKRLPVWAMALVIALSASLTISLVSVQEAVQLIPSITHAYSYNHIGLVLLLAVTIFALGPKMPDEIELPVALLVGFTLYFLALVKPTFSVMTPFFLLSCLIQYRWKSTIAAVLGICLTILLLDPGMNRVLGSFDALFSNPTVGEQANLESRLMLGSGLIVSNLMPILFALSLMGIATWHRRKAAAPFLLSTILCAIGYFASVLTMSTKVEAPILLPYLSVFVICLASSKTILGNSNPLDVSNMFLRFLLPICMSYSIILPALLGAGWGWVSAQQYVNSSIVSDGPLRGYFVRGKATAIVGVLDSDVEVRFSAAIQETERLWKQNPYLLDDSAEYVILAEGIRLLRRIPEIEKYGIVSNGRMFEFTMPLQSKVVPSFSVWPTAGMASFRAQSRLGDDIDIVMISRELPHLDLITADLISLMNDDFEPCIRSGFWTLFVRDRNVCNLISH